MRFFKRLPSLALAVLLAMSSIVSAFASGTGTISARQPSMYSRPDVSRATSLNIWYHQKQLDFEKVEFQVYKVADMTGEVAFELDRTFSRYPVRFGSKMTAAAWTNLAEVLAGYVTRDGLKPDFQGETNKRGELYIPKMDAGLYLVIGGSHQREYKETVNGETVLHKVYYHCAPFLIATPNLVDDPKSNDLIWDYDVEISPKFTASEEATISRRVLKVWDDKGNESKRPSVLTFDLLRNGQRVETVQVTAADSWRYQWDKLDNKYQWRIVERANYAGATNYTVTAQQQGLTYMITNRYQTVSVVDPNEPGTVLPPTDIPDDNTPTTGKPDLPQNPGTNIPDEQTPTVSLPQTGQLWWPVSVLAGSGLCLFVIGWVIVRLGAKRDESQEG